MTKPDIYDIAIPLISEFEGYVGSPYYCPALKLTIGYGEVIQPHKKYGDLLGFDIIQKAKPVPQSHNLKARNDSLKLQFGIILTKDQAYEHLKRYLKAEVWVKIKNNLPTGLTDNQCAAILSFVYNIGVNAFINSTFKKKLQNSTFKDAAGEFDVWVFAKGKKSNGLIRRRLAEKDLFLTGL